MGLSFFSKDRYDEPRQVLYISEDPSSARYKEKKRSDKKLPNPDPNNYKILQGHQIGDFLVLKIRYPDCTNYEGIKILLYKDVDIKTLLKQRKIDPHFSENTHYKSPLARFEPTEYGWRCAIRMAMYMQSDGE